MIEGKHNVNTARGPPGREKQTAYRRAITIIIIAGFSNNGGLQDPIKYRSQESLKDFFERICRFFRLLQLDDFIPSFNYLSVPFVGIVSLYSYRTMGISLITA